jgi:hypothetical protein
MQEKHKSTQSDCVMLVWVLVTSRENAIHFFPGEGHRRRFLDLGCFDLCGWVGVDPTAVSSKVKEATKVLKLLPRRQVLVGPRGAKFPYPVYIEVRDEDQSLLLGEGPKLPEKKIILVQGSLPQVTGFGIFNELFRRFLKGGRLPAIRETLGLPIPRFALGDLPVAGAYRPSNSLVTNPPVHPDWALTLQIVAAFRFVRAILEMSSPEVKLTPWMTFVVGPRAAPKHEAFPCRTWRASRDRPCVPSFA